MNTQLIEIATALGVETIGTTDATVYDLTVAQIKAGLEAAYWAGRADETKVHLDSYANK